jgi:hypothetical protein
MLVDLFETRLEARFETRSVLVEIWVVDRRHKVLLYHFVEW